MLPNGTAPVLVCTLMGTFRLRCRMGLPYRPIVRLPGIVGIAPPWPRRCLGIGADGPQPIGRIVKVGYRRRVADATKARSVQLGLNSSKVVQQYPVFFEVALVVDLSGRPGGGRHRHAPGIDDELQTTDDVLCHGLGCTRSRERGSPRPLAGGPPRRWPLPKRRYPVGFLTPRSAIPSTTAHSSRKTLGRIAEHGRNTIPPNGQAPSGPRSAGSRTITVGRDGPSSDRRPSTWRQSACA